MKKLKKNYKFLLILLISSTLAFAAGTRLKDRVGVTDILGVDINNMQAIIDEGFRSTDEVSSEDMNIKFKAVDTKIDSVKSDSQSARDSLDSRILNLENNIDSSSGLSVKIDETLSQAGISLQISDEGNGLSFPRNQYVLNNDRFSRKFFLDVDENDSLDNGEEISSKTIVKINVKPQYENVVLYFFGTSNNIEHKVKLDSTLVEIRYNNLGNGFVEYRVFNNTSMCTSNTTALTEQECLDNGCQYRLSDGNCSASQNYPRTYASTPKIEVYDANQSSLLEVINFPNNNPYEFDLGQQFFNPNL